MSEDEARRKADEPQVVTVERWHTQARSEAKRKRQADGAPPQNGNGLAGHAESAQGSEWGAMTREEAEEQERRRRQAERETR